MGRNEDQATTIAELVEPAPLDMDAWRMLLMAWGSIQEQVESRVLLIIGGEMTSIYIDAKNTQGVVVTNAKLKAWAEETLATSDVYRHYIDTTSHTPTRIVTMPPSINGTLTIHTMLILALG